jgi:sporulation protein YlmC with PRC-barrel domain
MLKLAAVSLATGLGIQVASAQTSRPTDSGAQANPGVEQRHQSLQYQDHEKSTGLQSQQSQYQSQKSVRLSELMDAKVETSGGDNLGSIEDFVISPSDGQIKFVVLGKGGFLGIGENLIPVPWQSISVGADNKVTSTLDENKLENAPKLDSNYSQLNNPGFANTVNQHFGVTGATGAGETTGEFDLDTDTGTEKGLGTEKELDDLEPKQTDSIDQ